MPRTSIEVGREAFCTTRGLVLRVMVPRGVDDGRERREYPVSLTERHGTRQGVGAETAASMGPPASALPSSLTRSLSQLSLALTHAAPARPVTYCCVWAAGTPSITVAPPPGEQPWPRARA